MIRNISCLFLVCVSVAIFSCSSPSDADKENSHGDPPLNDQVTESEITITDTVPHPSDELKNFLSEVSKISFTQQDTSRPFFTSDHKNYFGLLSVQRTFSAFDIELMKRTWNSCLRLRSFHKQSGISEINVEEWIFNDEKEALYIENMLSRPLENKMEERFVRTPFTFWRSRERIYYVYTEFDRLRTSMEKVNNVLVNCLTPSDQ